MNEDNKRIKRIVKLIMLIIILLLLIKSCASEFDWTIGKLFGTSSEHEITENSDDVIILNKNLRFDIKEATISLNDKEYKVSYSYDLINPTEFTCTTSDASIAICYVEDGYVVIKPKKVGEVSVYLETKTNNKIYKASMKLTVKDITRSLTLSSKSGVIVLSKTNKKILTYNMNNIDGKVVVTSSNKEIATAVISKNVITITAYKAGNCKIIVSVIDKNSNIKYSVTYNLLVVNNANDLNNNNNSNNENNTPDKPIEENVKDSNNYLSLISVDKGELSPKFNKNINNYNINLDSDIDKISFNIKKDSDKSSIKYTFNNKNITNLNNLQLSIGDNVLKIKVTAENGKTRTYTIIINRKQVSNYSNYLNSLNIEGYDISFDKTKSFYELTVPYNKKEISLNYTLEDLNNKVRITLNNNEITNLNNIKLNTGNNRIEITITSNQRNIRIYVIDIYRPDRTIEFLDDSYSMNIEQAPYYISYRILEDGIEINDYNLSDISLSIENINGTYELNRGYILIDPNHSDIDKIINISISYNGKESTTKLKINTNKYYVNSPAFEYDMSYVNNTGKKNIIINNNILIGPITKTDIANGFRLSTSNGAYIDVITNDNLVDIDYDQENSSNSSLVIKVTAIKSGSSKITITGNVFGEEVNKYTIKLNIIDKYNIVIDANGGFFDSVTDKYIYLVEKDDEIDLSILTALKVADLENCLFYKLDSFNTKKDGTGTKYNKNQILTNFESDLTLYVIYTTTSSFETLSKTERLYLTEVNLFHNEEYYEKYNEDKVIYPGAEGAHVMSLTNNGIGKIKITAINLEEDTLCISAGKCLNIGYIIKSALNDNEPYTYFYGNNNGYQILNKDNNTTHVYGTLTGYHTENNISFTPNLEIEVGETKEISILWKWVEVDDSLDTEIGKNTQTIGNIYSLTVSIDFERENNTCVLP